jgi:hypothetical protein
MATELGVQGFLLLAHRIVPVLFAPFPDGLQSSTKPLGNCLHVHCELPLSAAGAYVHKTQEIEGCRFLSPHPCALGCISPEFNQPRLLRVQSQAVFPEPVPTENVIALESGTVARTLRAQHVFPHVPKRPSSWSAPHTATTSASLINSTAMVTRPIGVIVFSSAPFQMK